MRLSADRVLAEREFQTMGAAMVKARERQSVTVLCRPLYESPNKTISPVKPQINHCIPDIRVHLHLCNSKKPVEKF